MDVMRAIGIRKLHAALLFAEGALVVIVMVFAIANGRMATAGGLAVLPLVLRIGYCASLTLLSRILFRTPQATRPFSLSWFGLIARGGVAIFRNQIDMAFSAFPSLMPTGDGKGPVIALVHGYACNPACFGGLPCRLQARGLDCAAIALSNPMGDVEASALEAATWLAALRQAAIGRPIVAVGISMGGIVLRLALARPGAQAVDGLVTISSPHAGTWTGYAGFGPAARQMRPGSAITRVLAELPLPCRTIAVWTPDDAIILPPESGRLAGADEIAVPGHAHLAIVEAPEVEAAILRAAAESMSSEASGNGSVRSLLTI